MFVFDSHAHVIPPIDGVSGYANAAEHLAVCQRAMHEHLSQPARRLRDNRIVEKKLWDPNDDSANGRLDVNFRVGTCGRFLWEQDGELCYIQYLPPYAEKMSISPEMLKTMMDYAGVDAAVLQCGSVYGKLNDYYGTMMQENPWAEGVLFPLARIDENRASESIVLDSLDTLFSKPYLKGLWFAGSPGHFGPEFDPFWKKMQQLGIPVFLLFFPDKNWVHSFRTLGRWASLFGDIPCVLAQAFPLSAREKDDHLVIPEYTRDIIRDCNFLIEVVYPIGRGVAEEYPFRISIDAVARLYQTFGPDKLVWGSDIPMVERYCSYAQSLNYLFSDKHLINERDAEKLVGENLKKLFMKGNLVRN